MSSRWDVIGHDAKYKCLFMASKIVGVQFSSLLHEQAESRQSDYIWTTSKQWPPDNN